MKTPEQWVNYLDQTGGPLGPLVRRCATHTITQAMQQAREQALEEATNIAPVYDSRVVANDIRALKTQQKAPPMKPSEKAMQLEWPEGIVAHRHEVSGNWVLWYLTDSQAKACAAALEAQHRKTWALAMQHAADKLSDMMERDTWTGYAAETIDECENPATLAKEPSKFYFVSTVRRTLAGISDSPCPPIEATKDK